MLRGTKHVLHLNGESQLIGESGAAFKRWINTIMMMYYKYPLVPIDWWNVLIQYRRECWRKIEVIVTITLACCFNSIKLLVTMVMRSYANEVI